MLDLEYQNPYDDENTPRIDLPQNKYDSLEKSKGSVEPLPESTRPRKDGPGGE